MSNAAASNFKPRLKLFLIFPGLLGNFHQALVIAHNKQEAVELLDSYANFGIITTGSRYTTVPTDGIAILGHPRAIRLWKKKP